MDGCRPKEIRHAVGVGVSRYGKLIRGWDWRTRPERLAKAEQRRGELGLNRTQFLEYLIDKELGMEPTFEIKQIDDTNVATVTYPDGSMFTPMDWQGPQPQTADEVAHYTWCKVDNADPTNTDAWTPAIMLNGWPRIL